MALFRQSGSIIQRARGGTNQVKRPDPVAGGSQPHACVWGALGLSLLVVSLLFAVYEFIERRWLMGVDGDVLYSLHLLRGLAAGVLAAVTSSTWLLLPTKGTPRRADRSTSTSLSRFVQRFGLRTKLVVPMVALAVVPALAVGAYTIHRMQRTLEQKAEARIGFVATARVLALNSFVGGIEQDLIFLANLPSLRELVTAEHLDAPVESLKEEVIRELVAFSQGERAFYQVRYLNEKGHEVIRLNVEDGLPKAVAQDGLQDKSRRYYVQAGFGVPAGQIYTSAVDLNIERGQVQMPYQRVVRYAAQVRGAKDAGRGLLVINVNADYLFALLGTLPEGEQAWLLDESGTYIGHRDSAGVAEEMSYHLSQKRVLADDVPPAEARIILAHREDVATSIVEDGMLAFASIQFAPKDPQRFWTLLIAHSGATIRPPIRYVLVSLSVFLGIVVAMSAMLGIFVAHYFARPVEALRAATRSLSSGDLSRRVEVHTGDEIEDLATDFNTMAAELSAAQQQLAGWNHDLEQEVQKQTERLREWQHEFARADKLASLGQMTASVMHEVGNPLAAMKTRIQVAQEERSTADGRLTQETDGTQKLLAALLGEVDRLARFLRSFSRVARAPKATFGAVDIAEVVDSVRALLAAELRGRGLTLEVDFKQGEVLCLGNVDLLRQLLMNLLLNAADASERGNHISIATVLTPANTRVAGEACLAIDVIDRGCGMSSEELANAWTPFFTTKTSGTGLGLAICRTIVEEHGGHFEVDSRVGEGTTFRVFLQVAAGDNHHEG